MKRVVLGLALLTLLSLASAQQTWAYGALVITSTAAHWSAPGEDFSAASLAALADHLLASSDLTAEQLGTTGLLSVVLNALGREGWNLAAIDSSGVYIFKRPSGSPGQP